MTCFANSRRLPKNQSEKLDREKKLFYSSSILPVVVNVIGGSKKALFVSLTCDRSLLNSMAIIEGCSACKVIMNALEERVGFMVLWRSKSARCN